MTFPLSVLDLAPVGSGGSASESVRRTVDLARLADRLGYVRYWFAEHHALAAVASSAPEVLIAHVAAATQRIRVGSGGVMLPNHAPLRVAEAFRTLCALHPDRIDLGIGRAPGSDPAASRALRATHGEQFSGLMSELMTFLRGQFSAGHPFHTVSAMPPDASPPPIWILGSSGASAQSAGAAGMGYSFASHFSHEPPRPAFEAYRAGFRPSAQFPRPHAILGISFVCADTDERAEYLASSLDLMRLRMLSGQFPPIPSPEEALAYPYTDYERQAIAPFRSLNVIGSPARVREQIEHKVRETGADEVMLVCNIHGHAERLRSYELIAEAFAQ
jgi:luciferase family oxidoreductase group 1